MHIRPYQRDIIEQLGCTTEDSAMVEDIMRTQIFHSTLDCLSTLQFRRGVNEAWALLESERDMFEDYYRKAKQAFAEVEPTVNSSTTV